MNTKKSKSQKRTERQRRREERRQLRNAKNTIALINQETPKKKKSLPGFLAKYRKEISIWLQHYMNLFCKAENENIPYFKDMTREERNKAIQEYVEVSDFRMQLDEYLKEELKQESKD